MLLSELFVYAQNLNQKGTDALCFHRLGFIWDRKSGQTKQGTGSKNHRRLLLFGTFGIIGGCMVPCTLMSHNPFLMEMPIWCFFNWIFIRGLAIQRCSLLHSTQHCRYEVDVGNCNVLQQNCFLRKKSFHKLFKQLKGHTFKIKITKWRHRYFRNHVFVHCCIYNVCSNNRNVVDSMVRVRLCLFIYHSQIFFLTNEILLLTILVTIVVISTSEICQSSRTFGNFCVIFTLSIASYVTGFW